MTAADAQLLRSYLQLHGRRVGLQWLRERLGAQHAPQVLVNLLGDLGLPARVVGLSAASARFLPRPILFFTAEGRLALVHDIRRGGFVVEEASGGSRKLDARGFEAMSAERAVQLEAAAVPSSLGGLAWHVLGTTAPSLRFAFAAALLASVAALLSPLGAKIVFDSAIPDANPSLLALVGLGALAVAVHRAGFGLVRDAAARALHARSMELWLAKIVERVLRLPFRELSKLTTSDRVQVVRSAEALLRTCTESTLVPIFDALFAVLFLGVVAWYLPALALGAALACAVSIVATQFASARCAALSEQALEADAAERQHLMDLIHGAEGIKAAGAVEWQSARWLETLMHAQKRALAAERLSALLGAASTLLYRRLLPLASLTWAGTCVLEGTLSMGGLVAALQAMYGMGDSLARVTDVSVRLWKLRGDLRRVRAALSAPAELIAEAAPSDSSAVAIRMDKVWFRYDRGSRWTLRDYRLEVPRGTIHHLTGSSGCGKTTILRLLAGLYQPDRGSVVIDGIDARDARSHVAYLPQTTRLVHGTILDNLRLLSGGASEARIASAAAATGLDRLLESWPMGFETIVPAGAASLSGGQRQLIALTACVASARPIVLLDEALSQIDPVARERLNLHELFLAHGRTVIAVTHEAKDQKRQQRAASTTQRWPAPLVVMAAAQR